MPPKKNVNPETATAPLSDVKILCYAMSTVSGFHVNSRLLATAMGMNVPSNATRKLRTIVEAAGFELKEGKITPKDGSFLPDAAGPSAAAAPAKGKRAAPKTEAPAGQRASKRLKGKGKAAEDEDEDDEETVKLEKEIKIKEEGLEEGEV
ncbi:hypothetical protein PG985_011791 [Apiospora marii]|uniref:Histone H1 n=1 Tax=Apiospora marii TaxID=335849 RepID=A0ABR1R1W3_9PEZI